MSTSPNYLVINDTVVPHRYHMGTGFSDTETTSEIQAAKVYTSLPEAAAMLHRRSDLYAAGWRVVPADRS